jgi:hypothetical protein
VYILKEQSEIENKFNLKKKEYFFKALLILWIHGSVNLILLKLFLVLGNLNLRFCCSVFYKHRIYFLVNWQNHSLFLQSKAVKVLAW